jgi:hypothetical protein
MPRDSGDCEDIVRAGTLSEPPNTRLVLKQESSRSAHRSRAVVGVQLSTLGETSGRTGRGRSRQTRECELSTNGVTAFETVSIPDSQIGSPSMDKK